MVKNEDDVPNAANQVTTSKRAHLTRSRYYLSETKGDIEPEEWCTDSKYARYNRSEAGQKRQAKRANTTKRKLSNAKHDHTTKRKASKANYDESIRRKRSRTQQGIYNQQCEERATLEANDRVRYFEQLKKNPMDHVCALCWEQDEKRITGDLGWKWYSHLDLLPIYDAWLKLQVLGEPYEMEVDFFDLVRKDSTQTVPIKEIDEAYPYVLLEKVSDDDPMQQKGLHLKMCHCCDLAIRNRKIPKRSLANDLFRGRVPAEIRCLTYEELRLISLIDPLLTVKDTRVRYPSKDLHNQKSYETGQYYATGNLCCMPSSVCELAHKLPRRPSLSKMINVVRMDAKGRTYERCVRAAKLRAALIWLIKHNALYRHVEIDEDVLDDIETNGSEQRNRVRTILNEDESGDNDFDFKEDSLITSFTNAVPKTVEDAMANLVKTNNTDFAEPNATEDNLPQTIVLESVGDKVPDFTTPVFAYAHPELFPYGVGDYVDNNNRRTFRLSRNEWIRHMLLTKPNSDENDMYALADNGDCQTHPDFLQYGRADTHPYLISMMYKLTAKANVNGLMYVADKNKGSTAQNTCDFEPGDSTHFEGRRPKDIIRELRAYATASPEMKKQTHIDVRQFVYRLLPYSDKVPGSKLFMDQMSNELRDFVSGSHGSPTWFGTFTAADERWPYLLARLYGIELEDVHMLSEFERKMGIKKNPVDTTLEFWWHWLNFKESILYGSATPVGNIEHIAARAESQSRLSLHIHYLLWIAFGYIQKCLDEYNAQVLANTKESFIQPEEISYVVNTGRSIFSVEKILKSEPCRRFFAWFVDKHCNALVPPCIHDTNVDKRDGDPQMNTDSIHPSTLVPTEEEIRQDISPRWNRRTKRLYYPTSAKGVLKPKNPNQLHALHMLRKIKKKVLSHICQRGSRCEPKTEKQRVRARLQKYAMWGCNHGGNTQLCLFRFPRPAKNNTEIAIENLTSSDKSKRVRIDHQREDERINPTNDHLVFSGRNNQDLQPCVDAYGCAYYICEYTSKMDTDSTDKSLVSVIEKVCATTGQHTADNIEQTSCTKLLKSILMKEYGEAHIGIQMMISLLLGYKIFDKDFEVHRYPADPAKNNWRNMDNQTLNTDANTNVAALFKTNKCQMYAYRPLALSDRCEDRFWKEYEYVRTKAFNIQPKHKVPSDCSIIIDGERWFDLNDVTRDEKVCKASERLLLSRHDVSCSRRVYTCLGTIKQNSEAKMERRECVCFPWIPPNLDDTAYCQQCLYRFVPWRNPKHLLPSSKHDDPCEMLQTAIKDKQIDLEVDVNAQLGQTVRCYEQQQYRKAQLKEVYTLDQTRHEDQQTITHDTMCVDDNEQPNISISNDVFVANEQTCLEDGQFDEIDDAEIDPKHLLPEHPCAQSSVFHTANRFQARREYTANDMRNYHEFLDTELDDRRNRIRENLQTHFERLRNDTCVERSQPDPSRTSSLIFDSKGIDQFKNWRGINQWEKDTGKAILRMLPMRLYNQLEILSFEQQSAAECVFNAWEKYLYDPYRDEILRHMVEQMHASLSIIMGVAGSGKSRLILALTKYFQYTAMQKYVEDDEHHTVPTGRFFCVTATTGLAACSIEGQTIYRATGFSPRGAHPSAESHSATTTIDTTRLNVDGTVEMLAIHGYAALLLDEVSFFDVIAFDRLDKHLRNLTRIDAPFGGYFVIFLGDFKQLPPPMTSQTALYNCNNPKPLDRCKTDAQRRNHPGAEAGYTLWMSIKNVNILTESFRHKFDGNYLDLVTKLRMNAAGEAEQRRIQSTMLSSSEIASHPKFSTALQAFPTNMLVWKHNVHAMNQHQSNASVANIWASFTYNQTKVREAQRKNVPTLPTTTELRALYRRQDIRTYTTGNDSSHRLFPLLQLQRGMPIMIRGTSNEFAEIGLGNGVTGRVWDIVYTSQQCDTSYKTRDQMATCCAKNHYTPPIVLMQVNEAFWKTYTDENGVEKACYKSCDPNVPRLVPIHPIKPKMNTGKRGFLISQLPLVPAYALTFHKLQGLTLDRLVVNLLAPTHMFCRGLIYVVFTRNKWLCTLAVKDTSDITLANLNETQYVDDIHAVNIELDRLQLLSNLNRPDPIEDEYTVYVSRLVNT